MRFDIITIFPEIFDSYLKESLLLRAQKEKRLTVKFTNLRDYAENKHRVVDDRPYGGGLGMVVKVEPVYRAIEAIKKKTASRTGKRKKVRVIAFSPRGTKLTQKKVYEYSKLDHIIMVSGRYEGIDERVHNLVDEVISVGDYILMGGELPAMVVVESVARLIPGVIGVMDNVKTKTEEQRKERKGELVKRIWGYSEYPQYTRPPEFIIGGKPRRSRGAKSGSRPRRASRKVLKVPDVLLKGDHKKIQAWRDEHTTIIGDT